MAKCNRWTPLPFKGLTWNKLTTKNCTKRNVEAMNRLPCKTLTVSDTYCYSDAAATAADNVVANMGRRPSTAIRPIVNLSRRSNRD